MIINKVHKVLLLHNSKTSASRQNVTLRADKFTKSTTAENRFRAKSSPQTARLQVLNFRISRGHFSRQYTFKTAKWRCIGKQVISIDVNGRRRVWSRLRRLDYVCVRLLPLPLFLFRGQIDHQTCATSFSGVVRLFLQSAHDPLFSGLVLVVGDTHTPDLIWGFFGGKTHLLKISAVVVPEHPGNHLGTARLLLAASFDRPMLYSLVGLLRNADDEDDDEEG